ncbi:MAG: TIGR01212 family radical SAM protein [Bdellovibrionaceae bacterium]|nr:TIGR01212 family radical SAM protein [Pseudobdellovibrionaceae bacterium]
MHSGSSGISTQPAPDWQGKPYYPISQVYRQRFGAKVIKVPVSIADTCPNRMGIRGMQTCIFCDEWGSFAYPENQDNDLREQILKHREKVAKRFNANRFLVYFQAYTTTFTQLGKLKSGFETALSFDDVVGLVVGTRPDCLSAALLDLWRQTAERTFLGVEFGVQSFDDDQLLWMRRGHTARQSIQALERVAKEAPNVDLGLHLIFGWPTENDKQIVETAKLCNSLPITNVKLHNLHVLAKTPLEELYRKGEFEPIHLDQYAHRVALFLEHLSPKIAVHRLAALSSRWEELIAPDWVRHKMKSYQAILDHIHDRGSHQGLRFP